MMEHRNSSFRLIADRKTGTVCAITGSCGMSMAVLTGSQDGAACNCLVTNWKSEQGSIDHPSDVHILLAQEPEKSGLYNVRFIAGIIIRVVND